MQSSNVCPNGHKNQFVRDPDTGYLVCESCGVTREFDDFQAYNYDRNGAKQGNFVRIASSSHKGDYDYKGIKIYHAKQKIEEITNLFGFSSARTSEVTQMVEEITEGGFGDGNWFPIFIGACCYVVMRKNNMPSTMAEVAAGIRCELHELGRMVTRVVDFLDLNLPEIDIVSLFERSIRSCVSFSKVEKGKLDKMVKEGRLLLNCSVKWFLTTGRQPNPVVVAVLVFVAELNGVEASIEELAKEIHAGVRTCQKRWKELKETLVQVAQALPWGKNVTVRNIVKNAPSVISYMELQSRFKNGKKRKFVETCGFDLGKLVDGCLRKEAEYSNTTENGSQYFEHERGNTAATSASCEDSNNLQISQECLSNIYAKFLSDGNSVQSVNEGGEDHGKRRKKDVSLQACKNHWAGNSDLSKKLLYEEIMEKNVGFNSLPPSFVAGKLACQRRREKIIAAKKRIDEIMQPSQSVENEQASSSVESVQASSSLHSGNKNSTSMKRLHRKKGKWKEKIDDIDWEDNIIETLLLHQVKEEEIEQGHYKRMLDLYVFDSEKTCNIFGSRK